MPLLTLAIQKARKIRLRNLDVRYNNRNRYKGYKEELITYEGILAGP